jgi:hypothetical protein
VTATAPAADPPTDPPLEPPNLETTTPGPTPKRTRRTRTRPTKAATTAAVRDQLANGAKAISLGVLMTSGQSELLNNPEIVGIVEDRCDKFGAAWAAVAEQDPRVAKWLETLMTGGVWIAAATQTASLAATLGVMSGRIRVPLAAVSFLVPELRPHLIVPPPPEPERERDAPPA